MTQFSYQIVAGWNNVGTLVNIETIDPSPTKYLNAKIGGLDASTSYLVTSTPIVKTFAATTVGFVQQGLDTQDWILRLVTDDALKHWIDTYCNTKVTIATKAGEVYDTYTNWNAIIDRPVLSLEQRFFDCDVWWWENVSMNVKLYSVAT